VSGIGIVHFGPGAFHRAHQADYVDRLLRDDPRWGIAAVALRSPETVEALRRQQGRYTLAVLDAAPSFRELAAHRAFHGPGEHGAVRARLADPAVRIVTSTVTEKGYCLAIDGSLAANHPDIAHDLARPDRPRSLIGWLALGLADRRAQGLAPFTPLCCDNLAGNGAKLGRAVVDFARLRDPGLADWIAGEARFPSTMVDSITPATDDGLRARVRDATGRDDAIPVAREAYVQWVVEDVLPPGGPDLAAVGVELASDVAAWERAKLRILNGAHSTLAYLGLLRGHATVADAIADPLLSGFVEAMLADEVLPVLRPSPIALDDYSRAVLARFGNPAIGHKLAQIAWDGSQKLPYRLLDTVAEALARRRPVERLAIAVAGWIGFVIARARAGEDITDPLADDLLRRARGPDAVPALLDAHDVFPPALATNPVFRNQVLTAADAIAGGELSTLLAAAREA
jgi:fructuronate reductase